MFTDLEKKIIALIQGDMPVEKRPYQVIAETIGTDEKTVLTTVRDLVDRGIIRRFGATLRHQKSGFTANAMVAWQVDEDRVDGVGKIMASFDQGVPLLPAGIRQKTGRIISTPWCTPWENPPAGPLPLKSRKKPV
ncbi:MAG: Lrp/AsnC family transcriptional regulator [Desulfobacterales bacterium]